MKKLLTLLVGVCIVFVIIGLLPVHGEAQIYDSVLRLHVLANSDSEEDQTLKLCVRDRLVALTDELVGQCDSLEQTVSVIDENLEKIRKCAEDEVRRRGYGYTVEVSLCKEEYPTRTYASLCFPSGEYTSLQVKIGEAQGQNWWCVLFPPLCLDAAKKQKSDEDAFIAVGLSEEQYKIITQTDSPKYQVRFKLLEVIREGLK